MFFCWVETADKTPENEIKESEKHSKRGKLSLKKERKNLCGKEIKFREWRKMIDEEREDFG